MKRIVSILLALSFLFTASAALAATYYVNVSLRSDLNVREGASYDATVIGHLFKNDTVDVKSSKDGWAEISYNGKTAYVRSNYLSKTRSTGGNGKTAFPKLQLGSSKAAVSTLQRNLNKIMGTKLSISGKFDEATKSVVIDFQAAYGLSQDGVVGTKTWAKIIELR